MYSLLVLGLVPGTNIQISFQAWLVLAIIAAFIGPRVWQYLRNLWAAAIDYCRLPFLALILSLNQVLQTLYPRVQWIVRTVAALPARIVVDR